MKPKLFRKELEIVNLCHFSSCDLHRKDESVNIPSPSALTVEMIDSLIEKLLN
jgi:hypothetical protein